MWYLINSAEKRIYLKPNKELTFGRKKSDILLQNDESISRIHASIYLQPKEIVEMSEPISICKLKDMGSKYGTYILVGEKERMEVQKEGYNLKNGDRVRFGLQDHIFTVIYVPIITVVSTINDNDKEKLQNLMNEIDGLIFTEWAKNCTHLTVSKATLTEKVTWAMASTVPVVTLSYWEQVKCALDSGEQLPNVDDFVPPISESLIMKGKVSLRQNEKRKILFRSLLFVHFSARQYKMYGRMIRMAGGKSILYSKDPLTHKELCAPNVIVLQCSDSDTTQSTQRVIPEYDSIYKALKESKRQVISETDIPLAILYCSVDKYCNPNFRFGNLLKRSQSKPDSSEILALDTQDVTADVRVLPKVISNVPVKSAFNIKTPNHKIQIIPESYDISDSNDLLIDDSINQFREELKSSTPKSSRETGDSLNRDISVVKAAVQNIKKITSKKTTTYIPETIDSRISDATQKDTQCATQEGPSLTQQNTNSQEIEEFKESMIVNKGTPFNEVIDISTEADAELKSMCLDVDKLNESPNKMSVKIKSNKLLDVVNVKGRRPEIETISLPEKRNIPVPRKDHNLLKLTSLETEENNKKSRKRSKNCSGSQSDEEFVTSTRKRVCSEILEDTIRSPQKEKQRNQSNHSNLSRCSSSFLRVHPNYKKFIKVYTMTPQKRISMRDLYVWNTCAIQNL